MNKKVEDLIRQFDLVDYPDDVIRQEASTLAKKNQPAAGMQQLSDYESSLVSAGEQLLRSVAGIFREQYEKLESSVSNQKTTISSKDDFSEVPPDQKALLEEAENKHSLAADSLSKAKELYEGKKARLNGRQCEAKGEEGKKIYIGTMALLAVAEAAPNFVAFRMLDMPDPFVVALTVIFGIGLIIGAHFTGVGIKQKRWGYPAVVVSVFLAAVYGVNVLRETALEYADEVIVDPEKAIWLIGIAILIFSVAAVWASSRHDEDADYEQKYLEKNKAQKALDAAERELNSVKRQISAIKEVRDSRNHEKEKGALSRDMGHMDSVIRMGQLKQQEIEKLVAQKISLFRQVNVAERTDGIRPESFNQVVVLDQAFNGSMMNVKEKDNLGSL